MGLKGAESLVTRDWKLPRFPDFKAIELEDQPAIERLTAGFPPYAEFNFVEIWSWNSRELGGWTSLNGNLVIRWDDVITGELFLTFIGRNAISETIRTLVDFAATSGIEPCLTAVPASVVSHGELSNEFDVEEDHPNWDYLLSTREWSTISGARFKNKRNAIHRLERHYRPELRELDIARPDVQADLMRVFSLWANLRNRSPESTWSERRAIENLFVYATCTPKHRLYAVGVYVDNRMVGFSINERLADGYGIGHFAKADIRFDGIYPYLLRYVCRDMLAHGIELLNIEADLGDQGLAVAKHLCYPIDMLRKYTLTLRRPIENADPSNFLGHDRENGRVQHPGQSSR